MRRFLSSLLFATLTALGLSGATSADELSNRLAEDVAAVLDLQVAKIQARSAAQAFAELSTPSEAARAPTQTALTPSAGPAQITARPSAGPAQIAARPSAGPAPIEAPDGAVRISRTTGDLATTMACDFVASRVSGGTCIVRLVRAGGEAARLPRPH